VQGSEWPVPQVALLHTWLGEDQCRVKPQTKVLPLPYPLNHYYYYYYY